jgi:hypothetical protein
MTAHPDKENAYSLDQEEALSFYQEDAVVWLDPVDGTVGLIEGDRGIVTSNIGKSLDLC